MKKLIFMFVTLFLLIPLTVYAEDYQFVDCNITMNFDMFWDVFTEDNIKGNEKLSRYNITQSELEKKFDNNVYVVALSQEYPYEFSLATEKSNDIENLADMSDNEIISELEREVENIANLIDCKLYIAGSYKYKYIERYDSKNEVYLYEFRTTVDSLSYTFKFESPREIDELEREIMENVINYNRFSNLKKEKIIEMISEIIVIGLIIYLFVYIIKKIIKKRNNNGNNNQYNNNGYYNPNNGYNNNYNSYNNNYGGYNNNYNDILRFVKNKFL